MSYRSRRIAFIGDSHGEALGPIFKARLERAGASVPLVIAHRGWSVARYLESGELSRLAGVRPDTVIFELGGNDFVRSAGQYAEQLGAAVDVARAAGAREVVWVGPSRVKEGSDRATSERHERNAVYQESILPQMGVRWVDSRRHTYGGHGGDGVHFGRAGYEAWAYGVLDDLATGGTANSPSSRRERSIALGVTVIALAALGAYAVSRAMVPRGA